MNSHINKKLVLCPHFILAVIVSITLVSCASKRVQVKPPVALPKEFSSQGKTPLPDKWWITFGDKQLDSLVEKALRDNFSLRVAWDRLDQARAVASKSGASFWPTLDASSGASRTVQKAGKGADRVYSNSYSLGAVVSFEVDLWGRVRSTHEAAMLDAYASNEDLHAAAITLAAEVAGTWYRLIERRGQLRLLDNQIKTNEKYLELIILKFRRGQVSATDVLQQRQLVESTKGDRLGVESDVKVLEHQLAVLLGQAPGELSADIPEDLPQLPPLPQTGLPVVLIRRRPDVRAAELRVQAADQRVGAAIADQFPKLGLTMSAETSAAMLRNLFDNWLATMAANIVAPLFDGGLRRAEVERNRVLVSEQLNSYGQAVLTALREVEDALILEAKQAQYVVSLHRQLELSRKSTEQTLENYTKGTMDFTRYLTVLLSYQSLQRTHLQSRRELVQFRIDLYRALAGSWSLSRPERAKVSGLQKPVKKSKKSPKPSGSKKRP